MNFTEPSFLYFILGFVCLWLALGRYYWSRIGLVVAASLFFYGYHSLALIFLILGYCVANWLFGLWIAQTRYRKAVLTLGVTVNLGVLAYWKYTLLLLHTAADIALALDIPIHLSLPENWAIPIGLSFYAFTGTAYLVDIYRREIEAETSFWRLAFFLTFFLHLVAGPILRARDFLKDLKPGALPCGMFISLEAVVLVSQGFFKKMALA